MLPERWGDRPTVFISYSHADERWKDRLVRHLRVLELADLLDVWDDRKIAAGADWLPEIERVMDGAQVAVLLISADFLTSKFILGKEVPRLLERRRCEGLHVLPLIVRPCAWQVVDWLAAIQCRPKDGRALSASSKHQVDAELAALALEVRDLLASPQADPGPASGPVGSEVSNAEASQLVTVLTDEQQSEPRDRPVVGEDRRRALERPGRKRWRNKRALAALAVGLAFGGFVAWQIGRTYTDSVRLKAGPTAPEGLVIAVVPYYGPDEDSAKEGRVFATLVERNLRTQFHNQAGRILGIEETKVPVRSHDAARELARRLGATVVLWGHVLTLRGETEIEPSLTLLPPKDGAKPSGRDYSPFRLVRGSDPLASFVQRDEATLALPATTRSQIELRKTTAAGIGELVRTVAATHALYVERRPEKALALVSGLPEQSDTLRLKAEALVRLNRPAEALVALERVVTLDPEDAQALGLMGDLHLRSSRLDQAMAAYRAAAATANDFSTVEGLSFEGQILRREVVGRVSWSEEGEVVDSGETITSFLLMLDPETGRVSNRYLVPGPVMALNTEGGSPRITVEHRRSGRTSVLSLQEIASRPEVFLNLPRRVQLRTGGTALAENFLGELADPEAVGPARLSPRKGQLASDRPRTLAELDVSLRRASEEDPTQPLHLFFLGEVLWFQGRKEEAEHTWLRLAQGSYIAWPFSIYTYIADLFESFDQPEWADRFWAIAEEKARMRTIQPPFSSLIDRLIDVPTKGLYRSNRGRGDALRRFHRFQRAVEMTGPCMDGDELVATVWARFLTRSGERKAATEAKAIAERAASSRFNIPRHATATEYFAYLATGATTGLLFLLAVVAWRVARDLSPRPFRSLWRQIKDLAQEPTSPHDRLNRAALLVGGTSLVLLMLVNSLDLVVGGSLPTTPRIVLYDLMLLALILRLFTTQNNPIKALAAWAWRLRVSLCVGVLACAVSLGGFWSQARRLYMDLIIPVGLPEALGSFETLEALDLRPSDEQSAALQFVRAVAYHLAREETRAGRLYRSLAGREPRAKANLEALERGGPPVQLPTEKDYSRAFSRSSWEVARWGFFQLWDELQAGGLLELWIAGRAAPGAVGVGLILLLLGALGGRQVGGLRQRPELSGGVRRRLEVVLIPGVAWLGRGKPVLAWATVTLWSFVLVSCWFGISYGARTGFPGPLADALPLRAGSFARGFPWPYAWEAGQSPDELYRSAVFWSLPYAHRFWVIVALSGLTFLALHLLSLQAPLSRLWSPSGARTSA